MIHFIYKTFHVDGRYYIGRHSTSNIDDGYLGSGSWVSEMKKNKDDRMLLERHIITFSDTTELLLILEEKLISEHFSDPLCMNKTTASSGFKNEDWEDPISRANRISSIKRSLSSPEARERKRKASKLNWEDESYINNHKLAMKKSCNTPETKEKYSNAAKSRWSDTTTRQKIIEAQKEGNKNTEVIQRKKEILNARWSDKHFVDKMTVTCHYCSKVMLKGLYTRWHGEKCKDNKK